MYRLAATHAHHLYHTSRVLWPHRTCWSICGLQPNTQIQCVPLTEGLKPQISGPEVLLDLRRSETRGWCWWWWDQADLAKLGSTQLYSMSLHSTSLSTKSTGVEGACGNGNVHWTSHMMMMKMMMTISIPLDYHLLHSAGRWNCSSMEVSSQQIFSMTALQICCWIWW